jgi:hypothetical protein
MAQGYISVTPNNSIYNYTNQAALTGSTITVLKLGGGVYHGHMVSAAGAAATSQWLILDGTSSGNTAMFTISGTQAATQILGVDCAFTTALSIQSLAVTSTTPSFTILWK